MVEIFAKSENSLFIFSVFTGFKMKFIKALLVIAITRALFATPALAEVNDYKETARFAALALKCVHSEYPNHISHTLNSAKDAGEPHVLYPAFYGCFDWHSSVHGHWLLAKLAGTHPNAPYATDAKAALKQSITPENITAEVAYLNTQGRASFERPYGLAWALQLHKEL